MRTYRVILSLATFGAAGLLAVSVGSMYAAAKQQDPPARPSHDDVAFAHKAAEGGNAEVKLGRLAEEKGSSETVKQFGKEMVTDHTKANENLKAAAAKEGITLPTGMTVSDRLTYDHLSKLSGTGFDRAYASDMVKDHEADISDFQKESNEKSDAIQNFASETLPTLQHHLENAKAMENKVGK